MYNIEPTSLHFININYYVTIHWFSRQNSWYMHVADDIAHGKSECYLTHHI